MGRYLSMEKIKISHNEKKQIMHIIVKLKQQDFFEEILHLLGVDKLTVIYENAGKVKENFLCEKKDVFRIMQEEKMNKAVTSILFLDGKIDAFEPDCEIRYLMNYVIRFFVSVDYAEEDINVLIKSDNYDDILNKAKDLM